MTDEELDEARGIEAWRIYCALPVHERFTHTPQRIAARLAREGWTPVDPDLIEARECAALTFEADACPNTAEGVRAGREDDFRAVRSALIAIKRARERGQ